MIKKLNELKNNNRTKFIVVSVISIILVLVAITTSTLALFYDEDIAANSEDYTTGILQITASSKSSVISLPSAVPMTDAEGMTTDPYIFTITNTGTLTYQFDVRLLSTTSSNNINPNYIKLQVDDDNPVSLGSLSNSIIKSDIYLSGGQSMDISIKVWLDINTPNNQLGKTFTSQLVTNGQAVYKQTMSISRYITNLYTSGTKDNSVTNGGTTHERDITHSIIKDPLGNLRYYGENPNNYVYYNCDTYPDTNCEKWRIIGIVDGHVKLIRGSVLENKAFDTDSNVWATSTLNAYLNNDYYNKLTTTTASSTYGLKNPTTRNMIDNTVPYYLGTNSNSELTAKAMLEKERASSVTPYVPWADSKAGIGIPYPSDYGYASNLLSCTQNLYGYDNVNCYNTNWIYKKIMNSSGFLWLITPDSSNANVAWVAYSSGALDGSGLNDVSEWYSVAPVLYLSSNVLIEADSAHDGSSEHPYGLSV